MKRLILTCSLWFLCGLPASLHSEPERKAKAALHHPTIVAVRRVYQSVEQDIARGRLKKEQRVVEDCSPWGDRRTIFVGVAGRIRKYVIEGGSDDSALVTRHYYDPMNRLRFVFITGGAVNGSRLEHRIYFDESGARMREDHAYPTGPGYTFPGIWPEGEVSRDPRLSYEQQCPTASSR